jgi:hypothetical protein
MLYCRAGNRVNHLPIRRSFTRCCDREVWSRGRWWAAQPEQSNTKPRDSCHWRRRSNPTCCWISSMQRHSTRLCSLQCIFIQRCRIRRTFLLHCNISFFSSVDRIIAATGFVRLPMGSQRHRSAASLAQYSPLVGGPQTPPRCKRRFACVVNESLAASYPRASHHQNQIESKEGQQNRNPNENINLKQVQHECAVLHFRGQACESAAHRDYSTLIGSTSG